jgi:PhzF family phenazine biosynthesis protein
VTEVLLYNSFTHNGSGGNPAGVVLNAENLSDPQKLDIARTVNYSETAFVCPDGDDEFSVSFFTPTDEVDFCGHATVAAFSAMFQRGILSPGNYRENTKAGSIPITIEADGLVNMEVRPPQKLGSVLFSEVAEVLSVDPSVISSTGLPIEIVSTGLPDIIVPIAPGYLDLIKPDDRAISELSKKYNAVGLHLFELNSSGSPVTAGCRNFAPLVGIKEESATGSASGALAAYLTEHCPSESGSYLFEQGRAMNCLSRIQTSVEMKGSDIFKIVVGGRAVETGTMAYRRD